MKTKKRNKKKNKVKYEQIKKAYSYTKDKFEYFLKIKEKYLNYLLAMFPIIKLIILAIIGITGIYLLNTITVPVIWKSMAYVLVFAVKDIYTHILDNLKYDNSPKILVYIILLIMLFLFGSFVLSNLALIYDDLNKNKYLLIPTTFYIILNYIIFSPLLYNSYEGYSKRSFRITTISVVITMIIQIVVMLTVIADFSFYDTIILKYNISKKVILGVFSFSFIGNIGILLTAFIKKMKMKNWREVSINSTLYRYRHKKGHVKEILKEGIGGKFIPIKKYKNYRAINNFEINAEWSKLANKLWAFKEPNKEEMIIKNVFISNPIFRMYYVTLSWHPIYARAFRFVYVAIGHLFSQRGIELYKLGSNIQSQILITIGIFFTSVAVFGYITKILKIDEYRLFIKVFVFIIVMTNILNAIVYYGIYMRPVFVNICVLVYLYADYKYTKKNVKKDYNYKYFKTLSSVI